MQEFSEAYRRLDDPEDRFDLEFWQKQGPQAIFEAAFEMIKDYEFLRHGNADELRIQRTIEYYGKK